MSANPEIVLSLVRSGDLTLIDDLTGALQRSYSPAFNKPGTFTVAVSILDPIASKIKKWSTALIFTRNGRAVWSGPCTSINHSGSGNLTTATFSGWKIELDGRYVRQSEEVDLQFTSTVGGSIIKALVDEVNAQTSTAGTNWPTHLKFGQALDTQTRTRSYKAGSAYGSNIDELINIEDGCDFYVDPLTREITTRDPSSFNVLTRLQFGYYAEPFNLDDLGVSDDGTQLFNRENVVGSNGGIISVDDEAAISAAGLMRENWTSLSDVTDATILGAYANAALVYERYGVLVYTIKPKPYGDVPRLHDDFELGDLGYLSADYGAMQLDAQAVRVFSAQISYDQQGNEIVGELGLAP